jgi:hypothetical protein
VNDAPAENGSYTVTLTRFGGDPDQEETHSAHPTIDDAHRHIMQAVLVDSKLSRAMLDGREVWRSGDEHMRRVLDATQDEVEQWRKARGMEDSSSNAAHPGECEKAAFCTLDAGHEGDCMFRGDAGGIPVTWKPDTDKVDGSEAVWAGGLSKRPGVDYGGPVEQADENFRQSCAGREGASKLAKLGPCAACGGMVFNAPTAITVREGLGTDYVHSTCEEAYNRGQREPSTHPLVDGEHLDQLREVVEDAGSSSTPERIAYACLQELRAIRKHAIQGNELLRKVVEMEPLELPASEVPKLMDPMPVEMQGHYAAPRENEEMPAASLRWPDPPTAEMHYYLRLTPREAGYLENTLGFYGDECAKGIRQRIDEMLNPT